MLFIPSTSSAVKNSILLIILLLHGFFMTHTFAQCEGRRYLDPEFVATRTHSNITYGTAPALAGLCNLEWWTYSQALKLDVYQPYGDTLAQRPAIVYAHGGAFVIGDKRMAPVEDYCYEMASRGYVVFSIDYRKCFDALSFSSPVRAVYRAVQDMNAAIRYVKEFAPIYGVDTNLVFAGGNSAGGFMALHAAYADEDERAASLPATYNYPNLGCVSCSGNSYAHSGKAAAVINLWGALLDTAWIEPGDAPLFSVHGGADLIVYPGYWPPFSWLLFPAVYGSLPINERADRLGIPSDLWYLPLEGHEPWLLSVLSAYYFDFIVEKSSEFLHRQMLKPQTPPISGPLPGCALQVQEYFLDPSPGSQYCWSVVGGTLLSSNGASASIAWGDGSSGWIEVRETNRLGALGDPLSLAVALSGDCCPLPEGLDEEVLSPMSARLSWESVDAALGYEIEGGLASGATRLLTQSSNERLLNVLKGGKHYRWRVRSLCGESESEFSEFRLFSTPLIRQNEGLAPAIELSLQLYPNPNSGSFILYADQGWPEAAESMEIFDAQGRLLHTQTLQPQEPGQQIDLSSKNLAAGLYEVRISGNTQSMQQRFQIAGN